MPVFDSFDHYLKLNAKWTIAATDQETVVDPTPRARGRVAPMSSTAFRQPFVPPGYTAEFTRTDGYVGIWVYLTPSGTSAVNFDVRAGSTPNRIVTIRFTQNTYTLYLNGSTTSIAEGALLLPVETWVHVGVSVSIVSGKVQVYWQGSLAGEHTGLVLGSYTTLTDFGFFGISAYVDDLSHSFGELSGDRVEIYAGMPIGVGLQPGGVPLEEWSPGGGNWDKLDDPATTAIDTDTKITFSTVSPFVLLARDLYEIDYSALPTTMLWGDWIQTNAYAQASSDEYDQIFNTSFSDITEHPATRHGEYVEEKPTTIYRYARTVHNNPVDELGDIRNAYWGISTYGFSDGSGFTNAALSVAQFSIEIVRALAAIPTSNQNNQFIFIC